MDQDHVPIIAGNFEPFFIITYKPEDQWDVSLDQVNQRSYDYVKLCRASLNVDIGIAPFSMAVCYDGTLVLPFTDRYRDSKTALSDFNKLLAEIFFGGIYVEAMSPDDLSYGSMTFTAYTKLHGNNGGAVANFHRAIRTKYVGTLDVIRLFKPIHIDSKKFQEAISLGRKRLHAIGPLHTETILYGSTFYTKNLWAESLIHLWTSIEQLVAQLWERKIKSSSRVEGIPPKARNAFLGDNRTWAVSSKLELLYQKGLIPAPTYAHLDRSRKSRNQFAHTGERPAKEDVETCLSALFELASLCMTDGADPSQFKLIQSDLTERGKQFLDRTSSGEIEPTHWLPMPPLPGDKNWGDKPFEVIEDLCLRKLKGP
jgi:hypothetical protein